MCKDEKKSDCSYIQILGLQFQMWWVIPGLEYGTIKNFFNSFRPVKTHREQCRSSQKLYSPSDVNGALLTLSKYVYTFSFLYFFTTACWIWSLNLSNSSSWHTLLRSVNLTIFLAVDTFPSHDVLLPLCPYPV